MRKGRREKPSRELSPGDSRAGKGEVGQVTKGWE